MALAAGRETASHWIVLTEFAGHAVQLEEPIASLYVDAAQAAHGPPSDPVYPVLHLQLVERLLPTGL